MKILFTGSSSFTGYWFVQRLVASGHEVVATFRGEKASYSGIRAQRVALLQDLCRCLFGCPFGTPEFLKLIESEPHWNLLCHHAADVTDYKSPHFNALNALQTNVFGLQDVLQTLKGQGCRKVLLTGSVFEQGEGLGTDPERAVSPYGLSKGLTSDYFRYYCLAYGIALAKFVIPNPFGPYEEARFTSYLLHTWAKKETAVIRTPDYVRDNIHASLLAHAYTDFAGRIQENVPFVRHAPSGYVESQGVFVRRVADAMRKRLGYPCQVELQRQEAFPEPRIRINSEPVDGYRWGWSEEQAWDDMAAYYKTHLEDV